MYRSRTRRRLAATVAVAIAFALGCVRVANLPPSAEPMPDYTWESALAEVRDDISATVIGIRLQRDHYRATLTRMSADTRQLRELLSVSSMATNPSR